MSENRPSPEYFLRQAETEEQKKHYGSLKIYLGAAPGVGKTYEMLHDALSERDKGLDIVIGVVESHNRKEIESMLHNFEILPREKINYHDKELLEFDLDGALRRNPGLILIDEMAHTNAPSTRHKKRWQDIKELLDRGINVCTTLNVQHIESLNDDIAQIIRAPIQETVPDSMIERADTMELVDIPPEELLKRLKEGKVYIPEQAELAAENFFKEGNLIALRELALRTMAERVGSQVLLYRQEKGIKYVWPTTEKILVCVGPGSESRKLIRAACRLAGSLQVEWMAAYVETPRMQTTENIRNLAMQNLHFAEQLGATTRVLTGFDIVDEIMEFAREQNITQIMVWKSIRSRIRSLFFRNLADEIVRKSGEIDVYIMTGEIHKLPKSNTTKKVKLKTYIITLLVVSLATGINFILNAFLSSSSLIMVYLLGITIIALQGEMVPAFLAAVLSVLSYDFFFVKPYYSFAVSDIEYLFTFLVMLIVSFIIAHLALRIRKQAESAKFAERQTATLHILSKKLAGTRGVDKILNLGSDYIGQMFDSDICVLLPKDNSLILHSIDKTHSLTEKELGIAKYVYELGKIAGLGTNTLSFSNALYVPLIASQKTIGVIRILPKTKRLYTLEQLYLLESFANQIALAIEVDRIQEKSKQKELKLKTNNIQSELIQSVSHDLFMPTVEILGDATYLMEMSEKLNADQIKKIGENIYLEIEQHNRLLNNVIQIINLESNLLKIHKEPTDLANLINQFVKTEKLGHRKINIEIKDKLPIVYIDNSLIQEVFSNLLDNAIKFSPYDSKIKINLNSEKDNILFSIEDQGPGIMPDEVDNLFEKYYRGREITSQRGLGLGLAICRAIIEKHGGKIWAENGSEGGAIFKFILPISKL